MNSNPYMNPFVQQAVEWEQTKAKHRRDTCTDEWEKLWYDRYPDDPLEAERQMCRAMCGF